MYWSVSYNRIENVFGTEFRKFKDELYRMTPKNTTFDAKKFQLSNIAHISCFNRTFLFLDSGFYQGDKLRALRVQACYHAQILDFQVHTMLLLTQEQKKLIRKFFEEHADKLGEILK